MLNDKEHRILELIKKNPYITQQDIANELSLSRSGIAGYISSLIKKGKIVGRAYVISTEENVLCIGGANLDRKAQVRTEIKWKDSNPVTYTESLGGVARNIAENLARLQVSTSLLTAVGMDNIGEKLIVETSATQIDMTPTVRLSNNMTGTYTAILNEKGEMVVALADMDIYDSVQTDNLKELWSHIKSASIVVLDTNFPKEVLTTVIKERAVVEGILVLVPVSSMKMDRMPDDLSGIDFLICNEEELQVLINKYELNCPQQIDAMDAILKLGVKNIVVTCGDEGLTFLSQSGDFHSIPIVKSEVKDVTGAGDALAAGIIYGLQKGKDIKEACMFGLAAAKLTVSSTKTVSNDLTEEALIQIVAESFK
ncbi:carbohydrate kinase [Evansella sp. AB-rgal1]|uniref:carbohydrate kinase n=1 Tax=Evansella sp. AB-rgal1 TaxID=3242696 RepID=UPI00359E8A90